MDRPRHPTDMRRASLLLYLTQAKTLCIPYDTICRTFRIYGYLNIPEILYTGYEKHLATERHYLGWFPKGGMRDYLFEQIYNTIVKRSDDCIPLTTTTIRHAFLDFCGSHWRTTDKFPPLLPIEKLLPRVARQNIVTLTITCMHMHRDILRDIDVDLSYLSECANLECLDVSNYVDFVGGGFLKSCKRLKHLDVSETGANIDEIYDLVCSLPDLVSLNASGIHWNKKFDIVNLRKKKIISPLTWLALNDATHQVNRANDTWAIVKDMLVPTLRHLSLQNFGKWLCLCWIRDSPAQNLIELDLNYNKLHRCNHIVLPNDSIQWLSIAWCKRGSPLAPASLMEYIPGLSNLRYLNTSHWSTEYICGIQRLRHLQFLNMTYSLVVDLQELSQLPLLEYLDLSDTRTGSLDFLLRCTAVQKLGLRYVHPATSYIASNLPLPPNLKELDFKADSCVLMTQMQQERNVKFVDLMLSLSEVPPFHTPWNYALR